MKKLIAAAFALTVLGSALGADRRRRPPSPPQGLQLAPPSPGLPLALSGLKP